jgi:starvation-inducible DNA-binding protein
VTRRCSPARGALGLHSTAGSGALRTKTAEHDVDAGDCAAGSLGEFARNARLKEAAGAEPDARGMIANLLADHEAVVRALRVDLETCAQRFGDAGTSDFLTGLTEQHEKMAWMLRAFLE